MSLAALGQAGIADCRGNHVPEALGRERVAISGHTNCRVIAIADRKHRFQGIVDRNGQLRCRLLLRHAYRIAYDIRPGHPVDIRPPPPGVQ